MTTTRRRVVISTDAANEADDQFAIVHALLSPVLDIVGIAPAHFGAPGSMQRSRAEVDRLLALLDRPDAIVRDGTDRALDDETTARPSAASDLLLAASLEGPVTVCVLGPLTDIASALLIDRDFAHRDVTVIWIGGPPYDGIEAVYGPEYNLNNDIASANVVFDSEIALWQIPMPVYTHVGVGQAELDRRVRPHGEIGAYLAQTVLEYNEAKPGFAADFRSLGDSPAIAVALNPFGAVWRRRPRPRFTDDALMTTGAGTGPDVRVCEQVDTRYLLEDFFAKIAAHAARA
ncbi:MAG: nucleoside hydrolase [Microbacterium sp.]|jgi:inosine-uridine nucleoside N-ribohydrolase|nr:nucleoside hydrolase [Microbacterium sp.]